MYFIPLGILLRDTSHLANAQLLTWAGLAANLVPVTLGNIFGGGVMVAFVLLLDAGAWNVCNLGRYRTSS
jgi:formate/nitrite transporter FocA (FNT family)